MEWRDAWSDVALCAVWEAVLSYAIHRSLLVLLPYSYYSYFLPTATPAPLLLGPNSPTKTEDPSPPTDVAVLGQLHVSESCPQALPSAKKPAATEGWENFFFAAYAHS
jgi:hypothetical protein